MVSPIIYMIRHGEKPPKDAEGKDPDGLSALGVDRAQRLRQFFGKNSSYSIKYIIAEHPKTDGGRARPYDTVFPLATDLSLTINSSIDRDDVQDAADAATAYPGPGNVLICWEHGELAKIAKAMGVEKFAADVDVKKHHKIEYPDDRFDLIWTVLKPYKEIVNVTSEDVPELRDGKDIPIVMMHYSHSNTPSFRVGSHRLTDLVAKVIEYSSRRGNNLSCRQKAALDRYRTDSIYKTHTFGRYFEKDMLMAYFTLFDNLFFGGSLAGPCKLEFGGEDRERNGYTICEEHNGRGSATCVIIIYSQKGAIADRRERMLKYLGVLLHEMAHAFLELYSGESDHLNARIGSIGRSGHGWAWQDVAFALAKNVADTRLLNLPLKLNRLASLGRELRACEAPVPRYLGRWGFAEDGIWLEDGIYCLFKIGRW